MAATELKHWVANRPRAKVRVTGLQTGIVMALLAVIVGTFFAVRPPEAYGICMACHGRDLINSLLNSNIGTRLTVSQASLVFPLLTTVGVVIGAGIGAVSSGEFKRRTPDNPVRTFIYGVLVMNFALLAAGCSIRLLLRFAHGELLGFLGFGGMVLGVVTATYWLQWRAQR
ncbi:MAG: cytochrome C [Chloroflexi bacterium]|nr:MAG: cytochrome C [Phototrophicales bacterium]RMF82715.1 MAG: cytochrome C [Chloroflexota bacterium]